ncbi:unnamed protein product [Euphydryas editha]|uniref:Uncharacterized protein n=1 Tax=Euphydryas editha TaxID=104508 RepID=A0AAU9TD50_EUPED|nr:unnamed protein product [Euphydryas editha]
MLGCALRKVTPIFLFAIQVHLSSADSRHNSSNSKLPIEEVKLRSSVYWKGHHGGMLYIAPCIDCALTGRYVTWLPGARLQCWMILSVHNKYLLLPGIINFGCCHCLLSLGLLPFARALASTIVSPLVIGLMFCFTTSSHRVLGLPEGLVPGAECHGKALSSDIVLTLACNMAISPTTPSLELICYVAYPEAALDEHVEYANLRYAAHPPQHLHILDVKLMYRDSSG